MPIILKKTTAVLEGHCEIEEAETLMEWLLENPKARLNLKSLQHPHTAVLQVLMVFRVSVSSWPEDETLRHWLQAALEA